MPSRACTAGSRCSNHRNLEPALKPECREFVVIGESLLLLLVIMLVLLVVIVPVLLVVIMFILLVVIIQTIRYLPPWL